MITSGEWLNPTRAVGLLAYGTAATCCGIAWMRAKARHQDGRLPAFLMLIESVLLLDIAFNWRWMLHRLAMDFAQRRYEYELRREPQFIAVVSLVALLLLGLLAVRLFFRGDVATLWPFPGYCCRWFYGAPRLFPCMQWTTFCTIR